MPRLKISYFDFPGGRGEVARLALAIGGIDFDDDRIPLAEWPARRSGMPLQAVPVLEVNGERVTQSNAINRYVGRLSGLYPTDALEALRCDEVMDAVEDVVTQVVATFGIADAEELAAKRASLVAGPIRLYLGTIESWLVARGGVFFVGDRLSVADLKVYTWIRNLRSGVLDHVPQGLVASAAPLLGDHCDRVHARDAVRAYYAPR